MDAQRKLLSNKNEQHITELFLGMKYLVAKVF